MVSSLFSGLDNGAGAALARRGERMVRDRRILGAGPGQVADRDVALGAASDLRSGDHFAELRRHELESGSARGAQLANFFTLGDPVADKEVGPRDGRGVDLVLARL